MSNSIALFKKYVPLLDEVYKNASLTAILDSDPSLFQAGANANEIVVPKLEMQGLAAYSRNSGYTQGDVTLTHETKQYNYERGRMFNVDAMDNEETAGVAFGQLAGEFIRTKVVPEVDAVRFAQYAGTANIGTATGNITDGAWYAAVSAAMAAMDDAEVPAEERYLFITPAGLKDIEDMDTTKSKACLASFAKITKVPQSRFYTKVKLNDSGAGGYSRDDNGKNLNFLIVAKSAVLQTVKHEAPKVITPEQNQDADAWKFGYRIYGLNDVYENKVAGIYAHIVSSNP
jgi:hypothetical protein